MILDTDISNIHVLNFSEPFSGIVTYEELEKHLYSDLLSDAVKIFHLKVFQPKMVLLFSDKKRKIVDRM